MAARAGRLGFATIGVGDCRAIVRSAFLNRMFTAYAIIFESFGQTESALVTAVKLGTRFRLAFSSLLVVLALLGGNSIYQVMKLNDIANELGTNRVPSLAIMNTIDEAVTNHRLQQASLLIAAADEDKKTAIDSMQNAQKQFESARFEYEKVIDEGKERERLIPAIDLAWSQYLVVSKALGTTDRNLEERKAIFTKDAQSAFKVLRQAIRDDCDYNAEEGKKSTVEAEAIYRQTLWIIGLVTLVVLAMAALTAWWLNRTVTSTIIELSKIMRRLAGRDYVFDLPQTARGDEIGDMARSIDECRKGLKEADTLAAAQAADQQLKVVRATRLDALTRDFEQKSGLVVGMISASSTELEATSGSMSETARLTMAQASAVSHAASSANSNVQTVAAAAEELVTSVVEMTHQVSQTAAASSKAAHDALKTQVTVRLLAESADRIGRVVGLINNIAAQTNLLALNATIEAARAGDAGKGFAVVASEVKALANQTKEATKEIAEQIGHIQTSTRDSVTAIEAIVLTIRQVSETTSAIAASVEQQGAATQEIAGNIQRVSSSTQDVTQNIGAVSRAAEGTSESARNVLDAAKSLSVQTETFSRDLSTYLDGVRAA